MNHELFIRRCLQLAKISGAATQTNPMVGAVIVHNDKIIGEGRHEAFGKPHAEVNAIESVKDKSLLEDATLYVNLEPCSHYGKTPPCCELITKLGIPRVVIGCLDRFEKVNGKGLAHLEQNGVTVIRGVLEEECLALNKRFFTFHENKRPYIILKWAETADGFIDYLRYENEKPLKISSLYADVWVHKWRSEEAAILVGNKTLEKDNPTLNARFGLKTCAIPILLGARRSNLKVFDEHSRIIVFSKKIFNIPSNTILHKISDINEILSKLYKMGIPSLFVEGGAFTHSMFLGNNIVDEIRIIKSNKLIGSGIKAAKFSNNFELKNSLSAGNDTIEFWEK